MSAGPPGAVETIEIVKGRFYWTCLRAPPADTADAHHFSTDDGRALSHKVAKTLQKPVASYYSFRGPFGLHLCGRSVRAGRAIGRIT